MKIVGFRKIGVFLAELVRSHGVRRHLELAYARMAKDGEREKAALEWAEATFRDVADEAQ